MTDAISAAGLEHLPSFIAGPGETDVILVGAMILLPIIFLAAGAFILRLHSVPDRMAHQANHNQLQLIGLLTLLALLTHNNWLWLFALIIAALNPPDLLTPLRSMARSLARISRRDDSPVVGQEARDDA